MQFITNLLNFFKKQPSVKDIITNPLFPQGNCLEGKALRYLIGTTLPPAVKEDNVVHEVSYDCSSRMDNNTIAYCNLFDEYNSGKYRPYLHNSDTAQQYDEGQIDPTGPGWERNLRDQFERRKRQGFKYIELDNPDAYTWENVRSAIDIASSYGFLVIAKNPELLDKPQAFLRHPAIVGAIVEKDCGSSDRMHELRAAVGKPTLPIWFVCFGSGKGWGQRTAASASKFINMGVTYSSIGEYKNSIDLLKPVSSL